MKYYLDLEGLDELFHDLHGLIEITKHGAESMVANDDRLELRLYEMNAPAFTTVGFKFTSFAPWRTSWR